ncbi:MAG: alcohol dehydrogenase catalytic domain-containing protein [Novosphingobium sp.]|nr:alcohol dehydrogenase catalytic domain-containing protein [Novosphingobium sp.]
MPHITRAAVAFSPHEPMRLCEVSVADPGPGQVLVRFIATGLCHSDLHVLHGTFAQKFPAILGHEGIGEIVEVGPGVTDFAPGDRVMPYLVPDCGECDFCRSGKTNFCARFAERRMSDETPFSLDGQPVHPFMGIGSFAELSVIHADMITRVSPEARPDQACCIACGVTTGIGAATITAGVGPGSSVAVFGAGGVGLSVVQGARLAGADKIIVVDRNPAKEEVARLSGGTHFIVAGGEEAPVRQIRRLAPPGVDYGFECVGIPDLMADVVAATNPAWGVAVCVGLMPDRSDFSIPTGNISTGRTMKGSLMGGAKRQDVARFVEMFVRGDYSLDHIVSHTLTLDQINHGFDMMVSGEAVRSVVIY